MKYSSNNFSDAVLLFDGEVNLIGAEWISNKEVEISVLDKISGFTLESFTISSVSFVRITCDVNGLATLCDGSGTYDCPEGDRLNLLKLLSYLYMS